MPPAASSNTARPRIDASLLEPVREFLANPIGHHSAALDAILDILRAGPISGKYCLVCIKPHAEWVIGRMSAIRGVAPVIEDNRVFQTIEDAERSVFRLRWQAETGQVLDEDRLEP